MLELLLGGAGSGKTYTVFEELTRLAEQEAPPALFLLVPEQFSFESERTLLRRLGPQPRLPCSGVELYTSCARRYSENWEGLPENGWTTGHGHCS